MPAQDNAALRRTGLRITLPRIKIYNILVDKSKKKGDEHHLSAEQIYLYLHETGENVSLPTVYRVLTQLVSAGLVMRHRFDGRTVYELATKEHHDHMLCIESGKVIEFRDDLIEELQKNIAQKHGYQLIDHELVLYVKPVKGK